MAYAVDNPFAQQTPDADVASARYRVGVDVGGTFTDVVCVASTGELAVDKTPTTPDDQSVGVLDALERVAALLGLSMGEFCRRLDGFIHGTTVADNAMIEMRGARTGMLVTEGHRDEIELRRCHKEHIWDPAYPPPPPIARRRARIPIPERVDFAGQVLLPIDESAVRRAARRLQRLGVRSVAVAFLFSFVNPDHERRARDILLEEMPDLEHVSLSHEVLPRAPEFERASTTLVNAYVAPRIAGYVERLVQGLRDAGFTGRVAIMQATGGVTAPERVSQRAVTVLGSGPTGGVMGAALAAQRSRAPDFVAVDMGGTSYDICLVRHAKPVISTAWNWRNRYYIGTPMVDVHAVGAGGGSVARVRQGALLVGPESAGAQPGPACYGRGGERATVTDADCVLGYLPTNGFAGGRMLLDIAAARAAIAHDVGEPLGLEVDEAAWAVERIVNATMADAVRRVLAGHGADPRLLAMIAYGGNGPVHASAQARELGIRRVLVPRSAPMFSALGLLVADYVVNLVRSYVVPVASADVDRIRLLMKELVQEALHELAPAELAPQQVAWALSLELCYPGQNFEISVVVPEGEDFVDTALDAAVARFHVQHERERGFSFPERPPLVKGVRIVAEGRTPKPSRLISPQAAGGEGKRAVPRNTRVVRFDTGVEEAAVYDGPQLRTGAVIEGPALIEEPFTVVVLSSGDTARLDENGTYDITIGSSR
jgi:N-methylhydantoinase A